MQCVFNTNIISGLLCEEPTSDLSSSADVLESYPFIGGYITYQCKPGYSFSDGTHLRTVLCVDNGQTGGGDGGVWHAQIEPCQGRLFSITCP